MPPLRLHLISHAHSLLSLACEDSQNVITGYQSVVILRLRHFTTKLYAGTKLCISCTATCVLDIEHGGYCIIELVVRGCIAIIW